MTSTNGVEFKQDAVNYYFSTGKSPEQVAGDFKISKFALSKWVVSARYAKNKGWDSQDKAIIGGANWIYDNYISRGQDTLYYKKWNAYAFAKTGKVSHQYATHIKDAYNKSSKFAEGLSDSSAVMEFRIPVFNKIADKPYKCQ